MAAKHNKQEKNVWRFDEIAVNVNVRIDNPLESGMDYYVGLEHLDSNSLKIRRWGTPDQVEATKLVFKKGDIIFGRRRAYQRKLGIAEFDGICSAHAMVLRPKVDVILPEFLPFFMQSDLFMHKAVEISVGSLSPTINWKTLAVQEFPLPSKDEQSRLCELLTVAYETVDAATAALAAAKTMLRSALVSIFAESGWSPVDSEISQDVLRPGWKLRPAKEICSAPITKGATPPGATGSTDTGVPFLKVYNLSFDGKLDFTVDPTYLNEEAHLKELARSTTMPGDVLMNIVGPPLGKVSIVPESFPQANINQAIARFRLGDPRMASFLSAYLLSDWAQRWLVSRSKKTSGQQNLTLELCRTLPVPLPPDDQVDTIIDSINCVFEVISRMEARKEKVEHSYRVLLEGALNNVH